MTSKLAGALFLLGVLFLVGCGGNPATVSGKVTLDGQPLTKGDISFYAAGSACANGQIDASGNYSLHTGTDEGLQPGTYQVAIVANDILMPTQPYGSPIPKLITPPQYSNVTTSGFTAEVKPGKNTFNFEMVTTP
jgi:hypothetical protein